MPTSESQPLCFVLMPFGSKPDPAGGPNIDFNRIYANAVKLGIEDADMFAIRADEEKLGGIIHKAMFERLMICEFAVADLTTSNPNVLYELGIRHAARPRTTLTIYAESSPLPFDVKLLHTQPYRLGDKNEFPDSRAAELRQAITSHLRELKKLAAKEAASDSPLFQLITGWHPEPLSVEAAESFQNQVRHNEQTKERLRRIRKGSADVEQRPRLSAELEKISATAVADDWIAPGVLTELLLCFRSLERWSDMIDLYGRMPDSLQRQVPIRQQLAFAYNRRAEATGRADDRTEALLVLQRLEYEQGSNPETSGLLGRIYKSRWLQAYHAHDAVTARRFLAKAVDAYLRGFQADWRNVYPGVNAVTLLDAQGDQDALVLKERLLPVVRFAAEQHLRGPNPSYWEHATILELAVLAGDRHQADQALDDVLATYSETWQPHSTAGNLLIIATIRQQRGDDVQWIKSIINALDAAAGLHTTADPGRKPS